MFFFLRVVVSLLFVVHGPRRCWLFAMCWSLLCVLLVAVEVSVLFVVAVEVIASSRLVFCVP